MKHRPTATALFVAALFLPHCAHGDGVPDPAEPQDLSLRKLERLAKGQVEKFDGDDVYQYQIDYQGSDKSHHYFFTYDGDYRFMRVSRRELPMLIDSIDGSEIDEPKDFVTRPFRLDTDARHLRQGPGRATFVDYYNDLTAEQRARTGISIEQSDQTEHTTTVRITIGKNARYSADEGIPHPSIVLVHPQFNPRPIQRENTDTDPSVLELEISSDEWADASVKISIVGPPGGGAQVFVVRLSELSK